MGNNSISFDTKRSVLQRVDFSLLQGIQLYVKRDDLIHPLVSGNKWRKLKYHIDAFKADKGKNRVVTFGGGYSNHLIASACAGAVLSIPVSGIVRGDELTAGSNQILKFCDMYGMDLRFVSREEYRRKEHLAKDLFGDQVYVVPEGGAGEPGVRGCAEIIDELEVELDHLFAGVGSGTTLAGLARGAEGSRLHVEGVAAIKNGQYLQKEIAESYLTTNFTLHCDFHGGGFSKLPEDILDVGLKFIRETGILLDPVYTIKVLYAMVRLNQANYFAENARVGILHTGGMTGWLGRQ